MIHSQLVDLKQCWYIPLHNLIHVQVSSNIQSQWTDKGKQQQQRQQVDVEWGKRNGKNGWMTEKDNNVDYTRPKNNAITINVQITYFQLDILRWCACNLFKHFVKLVSCTKSRSLYNFLNLLKICSNFPLIRRHELWSFSIWILYKCLANIFLLKILYFIVCTKIKRKWWWWVEYS